MAIKNALISQFVVSPVMDNDADVLSKALKPDTKVLFGEVWKALSADTKERVEEARVAISASKLESAEARRERLEKHAVRIFNRTWPLVQGDGCATIDTSDIPMDERSMLLVMFLHANICVEMSCSYACLASSATPPCVCRGGAIWHCTEYGS